MTLPITEPTCLRFYLNYQHRDVVIDRVVPLDQIDSHGYYSSYQEEPVPSAKEGF